jgi:hypothetical protein
VFAPIALAGSGEIDAGTVFRLVSVENGVAFLVAGFADQPGEDAQRIFGVGDARL